MRLNELTVSATDAVSVTPSNNDDIYFAEDGTLGAGLIGILDALKSATHRAERLIDIIIMRADRRAIDSRKVKVKCV
ncbi:hypothetical protein [Paramagnetospirillum caucaseum]|uniref:hypothetical protein n=1 Tax=Paramagnetospirillum caucaseum TaxID=1244869 RepID=UPI001268BBAE|nr:hypothetical protein [Paramagnetospirillum caucaseum]